MVDSLRPPAVPLVTVDPYFSVWSNADHLYDEDTKHWTYHEGGDEGVHGMVGLIAIDGYVHRFLGRAPYQSERIKEPPALKQTSLAVEPLTTRYTFEGAGITLQVEFMTPLLLNNLDVLSRPASYVTFAVQANDNLSHDVDIYFDLTGEWCVHDTEQTVNWSRTSLKENIELLSMGTVEQPILRRKGDGTRIDWGRVQLIVPNANKAKTVIQSQDVRAQWIEERTLPEQDAQNMPVSVKDGQPVMAVTIPFESVNAEKQSQFLVLAYDDIYSVEYFHQPLPGYWRRNGLSMEQMLIQTIEEYSNIHAECTIFNKKLIKDATEAGGRWYAEILSLAYRQSIAAHKLVNDEEGNLLFLSKECNSNGCIGTVDISYPSIPLYLLYNPALVKGMMRPIFRYANSTEWNFPFAPHDVGTYPLANGQVYGENKLENQMPIEECGNMLIMMAAVCMAEGRADFAEENWGRLTEWANYLKENGLDPGHQLCTDDFAGHLAHNANLSIKAIMGIGCYSLLCEMVGKIEESKSYRELAKEMAVQWEQMAKDDDHYKLTFDQEGTWSLKYNLIWDSFLSLHLFPKEVRQKEVAYYLTKQNRYGTPLDSRDTYTKADWLVWAAALADNKKDADDLIKPLWNFLNESKSRVPLTDWYDTVKGHQINFKNRSVVGGLFVLLMKQIDWRK